MLSAFDLPYLIWSTQSDCFDWQIYAEGILGRKGACNKKCLVILLFPLRYSSMTEDQATISSRCRDEKMAKKMNLPFRFRKKLILRTKRLALLDNKRSTLFLNRNLSENNRSIRNFAALGRWSTAQWTPSVRCWPDLVSPQNRWYFLRTKCIYWEQSVFPENKLLFLTTKCFF